MNTGLYITTIIHKRFYNFKHKFKYLVYSMNIDHDELIVISKKIKVFSYNKFNIFSYHEKDHGYRDGRTLRDFVENNLKLNKILFTNLKINIFCLPRILGYAFNPLSIIYCYNNKKLIAIFYEVKNTSNEQHTYFFASNDEKNISEYHHQCYKNFYVSPFIGMKAMYKFTNTIPGNKMSIAIDLYDKKNIKILTAAQYGTKISLGSLTLLKQLFINPMVTVKVIVGIIYEAIFIIFKGGKYYRREKKNRDTLSFEGKL